MQGETSRDRSFQGLTTQNTQNQIDDVSRSPQVRFASKIGIGTTLQLAVYNIFDQNCIFRDEFV